MNAHVQECSNGGHLDAVPWADQIEYGVLGRYPILILQLVHADV